ncbi:hypothetical protein KFK09_007106 [Dendrobium nobile]|uniref:Endonuclease/exonuclease/phosphatase domain-containing protein n=1 Tax=Dendrobium nobile TaxID=94219 RepID=A0A8T3BR15_DENNO|nr:hypothetical protein KFK09_007106 [Dendrobium nobile]
MISGVINSSQSNPFLLSGFYASNSFDERFTLWDDLVKVNPGNSMPWLVVGDFNCCRFHSDKIGGNAVPTSRMATFNNFIFETNLLELPSSGLFHTWNNMRTDNPIHLRLDRMLDNEAWVSSFLNSCYKVANSSISNHTPLILKPVTDMRSSPRFMFKNFWCQIFEFWSIFIPIFEAPVQGNPIISLY